MQSMIEHKLTTYEPNLIPVANNRLASVALILRNLVDVPEIFFIERAAHKDDPWSGQIAFPGGNKDPGDGDVFSTACRESLEEVGLRVNSKHLLGRLDDQQGRNNYRAIPLVISCFVFVVDSHQTATNNYEVADSFWVRIPHLRNPANRISHQTSYSPDPYPGITLPGDRVLWGLTYRFVETFLRVVD